MRRRCPTPWPSWAREDLQPDANIIKLPNISASVASWRFASRSCKGLMPFPTIPEDPKPTKRKRFAHAMPCIGSAVNPVLREGNSDRRAPRAVKEYARKNPHHGRVEPGFALTCPHMHSGDFYHGEKSLTLDTARDVKMELTTHSGRTIVLKPKVAPRQARS